MRGDANFKGSDSSGLSVHFYSVGQSTKVRNSGTETLYKMAEIPKLQRVACEAINDSASELNNIGQEIWKHPQQNYEEIFAHSLLTTFLKGKGFDVCSDIGDLKTAFRAVYNGEVKGPRVGIICEYDALPEIDHACGHNLIAEAGIAAALGG